MQDWPTAPARSVAVLESVIQCEFPISPFVPARYKARCQCCRGTALVSRRRGDDGAGFDHSALPNLAVPASLAGMERRGMFLMQALMDEVVYSETGSTVTLIKCCRPGSDLTKSEDS